MPFALARMTVAASSSRTSASNETATRSARRASARSAKSSTAALLPSPAAAWGRWLDSFTLAKQAAAWKATKPAGITADDAKVTAITGAFSEWKGQGFAEDSSPKATGLAKPSATITAKSSVKDHGCQLKVGSETSDKANYFVQAGGQPDVFIVPKWSVDRILVKLDDLKKK